MLLMHLNRSLELKNLKILKIKGFNSSGLINFYLLINKQEM